MTRNSTVLPPATVATCEDIIERLETAFEQIAGELHLPVEQVCRVAHQSHHKKFKAIFERNQAICRLRSEGLSNQDIAARLKLSVSIEVI